MTVTGIDGRSLRAATLDLLAAAVPGERIGGDLVRAVSWARPAALHGLDYIAADLVAWTVTEAAALGLAVDGTMTSLGRLLRAGDRAGAEEHTSSMLVDAPAEVILQADLTAVVDASAPQSLLDELRLLADAESAGSALVLRFSAGSIRRGLDAGRDAFQILAFLAAHAARGVPQPLEYLVSDTARRFGSVRVGAVASYVRAADPVLLEEAVRHRRLAKSGLRLLAPTVAVSDQEPARLLAALRDAGFLPVEEDASGVTLQAVPRRERSAAPARSRVAATSVSVDPADLRSLAEAVLAADAGPEQRPARPGPAPTRSRPALFEPDSDDELDELDDLDDLDPVDVFDVLVGLLGTDAAVELRIDDPATGWERAVTGLVADVDARTGQVTIQREPDGAMVKVNPAGVFGIRVLRNRISRR